MLMAGRAEVSVDGQPVTIEPDDVVITETPREGWAVHHDAGESLALDLTLTPELAEARARTRRRSSGSGGAKDQRPGGLRPDLAGLDRSW